MSREDDPLERELSRIFTDDHLNVRAKFGAEETIVAGARRIRRRRQVVAATGSVVTAVILVASVFLVSDIRQEPLAPAAQPPPISLESSNGSSSLPAPSQQTPKPSASNPSNSQYPPEAPTSPLSKIPLDTASVLGPGGYRNLKLGMSFVEAKATGALAAVSLPASSCQNYQLAEGDRIVSTVTISPKNGVVSFLASSAHSPEGIMVGSSEADLKATYPKAQVVANGYTVQLDKLSLLQFSVARGVVTQYQLLSSTQDCAR